MSHSPGPGPRQVFAELYARTGDYRAAAAAARVSERTGRRWRKHLQQDLPARRAFGLPSPSTRFFGRAKELSLVSSSYERTRLVTLLGPPGIGKSRLAIEFGERALRAGNFDEVRFCDMTGATGPDDVVAAIAAQLHLAPQASHERSVAELGDQIAERANSLWILDNCEAAAEHLGHLLTAWRDQAHSARFLVTSRRRLYAGAEATVLLNGLSEDSDTDPAAALLLDRARLSRPDYEPDEAERLALTDIANRVDRIPLALEIAAARLGVTDAATLSTDLSRDAGELSSWKAAGERAGTLDEAIAWSWDRLAPATQTTLAKLSVFPARFDAAAATDVIAGGDERASGILSRLEELVSASLVLRSERDAGGLQFRLLLPIREHARRRLESIDATESTRYRHARYAVDSAQARDNRPAKPDAGDPAESPKRLADLLEAFRWAREAVASHPDAASLAARAALGAEPILAIRGPLSKLVELLEAALAIATPGMPENTQGWLREALARAWMNQGHTDQAQPHADAALRLAHHSADRRLEARALVVRGCIELIQWQGQQAHDTLTEARDIAAACGDSYGEARALSNLGVERIRSGQTEAARAFLEQALVLHRQIRDRVGAAHTLSALGSLYHAPPGHSLARAFYAEALGIYTALGNRWRAALVHLNVGLLEHEAENLRAASERFRQVSVMARTLSSTRLDGLVGLCMARVCVARGREREAAAHCASALTATEESGDERTRALCLGYYALSEPAAAERYLEQARSLADRVGDDSCAIALEAIGHASALRGDSGPDQTASATAFLESVSDAHRLSEDVRLAAATLEVVLQGAPAQPVPITPPSASALVVERSGSRFSCLGQGVVDLSRRAAPRRILSRLVAERIASPGEGLAVEVLFEAGWPDQTILAQSASNRVHVALTTLRKLGLRELLLATTAGYCLNPEVDIELVDSL